MGDDPVQGRPTEVLLVPPPVRPRRMDLALPPVRTHVEDWIETDALSTPSPVRRTERVRRPPPARYPADIPVPDSTDEVFRAAAEESIEDPLTISNSNTVPLFGLAPERVADPNQATPVPSPEREREPAWPWIVAGAIMAAGLILACILIFA